MTRGDKQKIYKDVHRYASRDQLAQEALFWNALQFGPGERELREGLERLLREYESGKRRDDALFWLAKTEQIAGDLDASLPLYQRLREIEEDNDFVSRSAILPALALIFQGRHGDAAKAAKILNAFVRSHPKSLERPLAQFWLGRIAEDQGDLDEAARHFNATVKADPLGYYGLRSRMHLADKGAACPRPEQDRRPEASTTAADQVSNDGEASRDAAGAGNGSICARRVETTLASGLYRLTLHGERLLRDADASRRLQEFSFEELDELGLITRLAVMISETVG